MLRVGTIKLNKMVLNFLFGMALVVLGLINFVSYTQLKNLIKANHRVTHTYEVIDKIDVSLYALAEAEAEQRAFLISGNKDYLKELSTLKSHLATSLTEVQYLTKDNPKQKIRVNVYKKLIEDRLIILDEMVKIKLDNKLQTDEGLNLFTRGTDLSSKAKSLGQEIKSVEEVLLSERNSLIITTAKTGSVFLLVGSILSFIFLAIPFILTNIELMNRKFIEEKNHKMSTHLRQIIESTNDMIAALDDKNKFEIFNESYQREFKRLFGTTLVVGMTMEEALATIPKEKNNLLQIWNKSLQPSMLPQILEFTQDQDKATYELHAQEIKNDKNEIKGLVHSIRDITNRIKEHLQLQESYKKLSAGMKELELKNEQITLLVDMSDIMLAANSQDELSKVMAKYAQSLLTFSSGYLFIMHPSKNYLEKAASWGKPHAQETIIVSDQCWAIRLGRMHQVKEANKDLVCSHIKITQKVPTFICVPLMAQNDIYGLLYIEIEDSAFSLTEEIRLIITAFSELTALALANVRLRENLRYQSIRDALTGLYNRRYLEDALFRQLHQAERSKFSFALLMMDIDHFKKINDNYGHDAGDVALKEIGKILEGEIRQGDVAARYGGEEFLIMMHNVNLEKAKKRAEQIRLAVSKLQIKYGAQPIIPITISIGIAIYPIDAKGVNELIELADKALYAAKNKGRNKVVAYSKISSSE